MSDKGVFNNQNPAKHNAGFGKPLQGSLFAKTQNSQFQSKIEKHSANPFGPSISNQIGRRDVNIASKVVPGFMQKTSESSGNLFGTTKVDLLRTDTNQAINKHMDSPSNVQYSGVFQPMPSTEQIVTRKNRNDRVFNAEENPQQPTQLSQSLGKTGRKRSFENAVDEDSVVWQDNTDMQSNNPMKRVAHLSQGKSLFGQALQASNLTKFQLTSKADTSIMQKSISPKTKVALPRRKSSTSMLSPPEMSGSISSSLTLTKIPEQFNNKAELRKHFSRFGKLKRVFSHPANASAYITFSSPEEALTAKQKGKKIFGLSNEICIYFRKVRGQSTEKKAKEDGKYTRQEDNSFELQSEDNVFPKESFSKTGGSLNTKPLINRTIVARTDGEKLHLLEKIDKMLRSRMTKQSDLSKATVFIGTCPDMCPEKERYLRLHRNLLSGYETDGERQIDHKRCVKEYSRSSADQEEALTHELRPSPVLRITMDYLLTHVMNTIDHERIAEWYDYLWNRTRAIRKEISIQQAIDPIAVQVAEECARFHICCGHELCEMDRMSFDPKINNENLEKAMKTVLDMYNDIRFKHSCHLENESEFLGYHILLNINKSADVLRELQTMSTSVRTSSNVKLAVNAFSAVHSNNYSQFFKALQQASYLQAVIMHRYFEQVRRQACLTMARAYSSSKAKAYIPIVDVLRWLHFNDIKELQLFCSEHMITLEEGCLKLCRTEKYDSESGNTTQCSIEVSLKKQGKSLGEIVAHNRNPIATIHKPTSSFDELGRYSGPHYALLTLQSEADTGREVQALPSSSEATMSELLKNKGISSNSIRLTTVQVIREVIDQMIPEICKEFITATIQVTATVKVADDFLNHELSEQIKNIAQTQFLEEKTEKENRMAREEQLARKKAQDALMEKLQKEREAERQKNIDHMSVHVFSNLQSQVILALVEQIAKQEYREEKITKLSELLTSKILKDFVENEIKVTSTSVVNEARNHQLFLIANQLEIRRAVIYLKRWRKSLVVLRKRRVAEQNFPSTPTMRNFREQVRDLLPEGAETLSHSHLSFPLDKSQRSMLSLEPIGMLVESHHRSQVNLSTAARTEVDQNFLALNVQFPTCGIYFNNCIFSRNIPDSTSAPLVHRWKFGFACCDDANFNGICSQWLIKKLGCDKDHSNVTSKIFTIENKHHHRVDVCCRVFRKFVRSELYGTEGLMFLISSNSKPPHWKEMLKAKTKLKTILESKPTVPPLPLLIVFVGPSFQESLSSELCLDELQSLSLISNFHFVWLEDPYNFVNNSTKISSGLEWLARNAPNNIPLVACNLRELLEEQISYNYITPLYRHQAMRQNIGASPLNPCSIIEIYNNVISSVSDVITKHYLQDISWPAQEFTHDNTFLPCEWNTEDTLRKITLLLTSIQLPPMFMPIDTVDPDAILNQLLAYCQRVCPDNQALVSAISANIKAFFRENYTSVNNWQLTAAEQLPWQRIVDAVASSLFETVFYGTPNGNIVVAFDKSKMDSIKMPTQYRSKFAEVEFEALSQEAGALQRVQKPDVDLNETVHSQVYGAASNLAKIVNREQLLLTKTQNWETCDNVTSVVDDAAKFKNLMSSERKESERFESHLKDVINEDYNLPFTFDAATLSTLFS